MRWWAESAPPGWDRVKVSENLGATAVAPVAPVVTSLPSISNKKVCQSIFGFWDGMRTFQSPHKDMNNINCSVEF